MCAGSSDGFGWPVNWDKVFDAVEHVVTWGLEHRVPGQIDVIGVDEIQYAKGHKYLTLVYQIDQGITRLLWVGKERTLESFQGFFTVIGEQLAAQIEFVCSDMWQPYLDVIHQKCSQAVHILDRFHIVAKMNKALDEVRAAESRGRGLRPFRPRFARTSQSFAKLKEVNMAPIVRRNRRIASFVLPRYSRLLDKLNWNAKWIGTLRNCSNTPLVASRRELYALVAPTTPIDYLEFGVYRGASMRLWCELNQHPDSRFVGFDSFEGLPEDWSMMFQKRAFDTGGQTPEINDARVSFQIGWFQNTLPPFLATYSPTNPLVIHCDCDLYSSTLFCLTTLNPVLKPGSRIVFDEFDELLDEYKALMDYSEAYVRRYRFLAATQEFQQVAIELT